MRAPCPQKPASNCRRNRSAFSGPRCVSRTKKIATAFQLRRAGKLRLEVFASASAVRRHGDRDPRDKGTQSCAAKKMGRAVDPRLDYVVPTKSTGDPPSASSDAQARGRAKRRYRWS